jgi:hypothetical protein
VYIADRGDRRIQAHDSDLNFRKTIAVAGAALTHTAFTGLFSSGAYTWGEQEYRSAN